MEKPASNYVMSNENNDNIQSDVKDTPTTETQTKVESEPTRTSGVTFSRPVEVENTNSKSVRGGTETFIYGPSGYDTITIGRAMEEISKEDKKSLTAEKAETLAALYYGESLRQADSMFDPALRDTDRDFRQGVPYNGGIIGTRAPKLLDDTQTLKGLPAVHAVHAALGLGGAIYQPLWGAGFQISFKAPLLKARHEFDFMTAVKKERYGWLTAGFSFSASEMVTMGDAIRFAMDHMFDCTYHSKDIQDVLKAIPLTDVHTLLSGFATTIFPDGYLMTRGCPHCKTTYKTNISISRMMLADNSKINDEQREIIQLTPGSRNKRLTPELSKRYQELHSWNTLDVNRFKVDDYDIVLYFKVPSIFDALENSEIWINEIRDTLVTSMGSEITDNQRDQYMQQRAANTILRQYSHWVQKIVVGGKDIDSPEDINNSLISILENTDVRDAFVKHIRKFIRSTTIGVVALPPHECPSCKGVIMDEEEVAQMPETVAIDPLEHFFRLVTLSVQVTLPE